MRYLFILIGSILISGCGKGDGDGKSGGDKKPDAKTDPAKKPPLTGFEEDVKIIETLNEANKKFCAVLEKLLADLPPDARYRAGGDRKMLDRGNEWLQKNLVGKRLTVPWFWAQDAFLELSDGKQLRIMHRAIPRCTIHGNEVTAFVTYGGDNIQDASFRFKSPDDKTLALSRHRNTEVTLAFTVRRMLFYYDGTKTMLAIDAADMDVNGFRPRRVEKK